jgi:hypothetical protein
MAHAKPAFRIRGRPVLTFRVQQTASAPFEEQKAAGAATPAADAMQAHVVPVNGFIITGGMSR